MSDRPDGETMIQVVNSDRIDGTAIVVEFSDGTSATYSAEELAALRPQRIRPDEDRNGEGGDALKRHTT